MLMKVKAKSCLWRQKYR